MATLPTTPALGTSPFISASSSSLTLPNNESLMLGGASQIYGPQPIPHTYFITPKLAEAVGQPVAGTPSPADVPATTHDRVDAQSTPTNTTPDAASLVDLPNPLHDYPSYTYSFSLNLMTPDEFNAIGTSGQYTAKNVLIASAGRYDTTSFIRNQYFTDDFYFDDFTMLSVVAPSDANQSSNNTEIHFKIIEPYGISLIDRLVLACGDIGIPNYAAAPFMLQIDFFGSNDNGELVHPILGQTKYLPITLTDMQITLSAKGSEYAVSAFPYSHVAFKKSSQSTPANFDITSDTVGAFFSSDITTSQSNVTPSERTADNAVLGDAANYGAGNKYKAKSYANAWNAWQSTLLKNNEIGVADQIDFIFDPSIGAASVVQTGQLPAGGVPYSDISDNLKYAKGDVSGLAAAVDFNITAQSVNAGTTIESILGYVIKNSSYVRNQVVNSANYNGDQAAYNAALSAMATKSFMWFKIIPSVTLLDYDKIRNRPATKTVYNIVPYAMNNLKVDYGPGGMAKNPVKKYQYIYTGKNRDIIELDIKLNALYLVVNTAMPGKVLTGENIATPDDNNTKISTNVKNPDPLLPIRKEVISNDARNTATGPMQSAQTVIAGDLVRSIMNEYTGGDLAGMTIKILGDPLFIKQDDIFYTPTFQGYSTSSLTPNNSIPMDGGEVYVEVEFNAPIDSEELTGGMRYDPRFYNKSLFSSLYKISNLETSMTHGVFTQTLTMQRQPKQDPSSTPTNTTDKPSDQRTTPNSTPPVADPTRIKSADINGQNETKYIPYVDPNSADAHLSSAQIDLAAAKTRLASSQAKLASANSALESAKLASVLQKAPTVPINSPFISSGLNGL